MPPSAGGAATHQECRDAPNRENVAVVAAASTAVRTLTWGDIAGEDGATL